MPCLHNCKDLTGVEIEDDNDKHNADISEVLEISEFFTYSIKIITSLLQISNPTKQDSDTIKKP